MQKDKHNARILIETYINKKYPGRFHSGQFMGGNTQTKIYGYWYYDNNGFRLEIGADEKTGVITWENIKKNES